MDEDQDIDVPEAEADEQPAEFQAEAQSGSEPVTGKKSCLVSYQVPPKKVPYGSLAPPTGYYGPTQKETKKPKRKSLQFPENAPPEGVEPRPSVAGEERLVTTESHLFHGPGNVMNKIKLAKENHVFPGWLVELDDPALQTIRDMKNCLAARKELCDTAEELSNMAGTVGADVPKSEVIEILRRIPNGRGSWSFPHFMLAMGSPKLARVQGIFQDPISLKEDECKESSADGDAGANKEQPKPKRGNRVDRLHQPYKYEQTDTWPMTKAQARASSDKKAKGLEAVGDNDTGKADNTQYTNREKVFYSGLLIFEMYHTIRAVEQFYFQHSNIPEPEEKKLHMEAKRGFGVDNQGTKKLGFAEWDRPLAPVPKISPYMSIHPFVSTRWKITRPNEKERQHRRTLTKLQPIHLQVQPPKEPKGKIKVMENRGRIKRAMAYLSSQGNCVAMLPFSHYIIHLSDTFLQRLEEVKVRTVKEKMDPVEANNDWVYLLRDAKNVFFLHGLPQHLTKLPYFIDINRALKARKECEKVRKEHWEFIDKCQVEFRNKAWKLMHTERIPCGWLRENFVYTFDAYLPYHADLPIINNNTPVPL